MFDVILYSFLASFFLILLGTGIYIRFREKINQFPVKEKNNGLKTHFQKYRYWYWAVTVIVLTPTLYFYLNSVLNPPRFKPPPEIYVPPYQSAEFVNEDDSYLSEKFVNEDDNYLPISFELLILVLTFFRPSIPIVGFCFASFLLILGPWIFKFNKNSFLFQSLAGITSSILFIPLILYIVLAIFWVIFILSIQ